MALAQSRRRMSGSRARNSATHASATAWLPRPVGHIRHVFRFSSQSGYAMLSPSSDAVANFDSRSATQVTAPCSASAGESPRSSSVVIKLTVPTGNCAPLQGMTRRI